MFNRTILLGNLTKDPEVHNTSSGVPMAILSIAVNSHYKQGNEIKEEVLFMNTIVFGKQAENCLEYLNKGNSVLVEGRLREKKWTDKDTGKPKSRIELIANGIKFLKKNKAGELEVKNNYFYDTEI